MMVDPLASLQIDVQSYDVKHVASVYFNRDGTKAWTKCWFNDNEQGEPAVPIPLKMAIKYTNNQISKDDWLTLFYPKLMNQYQNAIEKTRLQLLGLS